MKSVKIFTDGACSGNPGPGGWAAIIQYNGAEKELCGADKLSTNNKMELKGVIESLKLLKEPCNVLLCSDSRYVCDAIQKNWLKNWEASGWRKANKKPVLNTEMWQELLQLLQKHNVTVQWVEGHSGHPENERCDKLAVAQSRMQLE